MFNYRDYIREYMRKRRSMRPPGVSVRAFERRARKLRLMREWNARFRELHPTHMREMCKKWREHKARQEVAIGEFLDAFERFEYERRCAEISREAKCR